eukprot:461761-Amphidinium_carterae.1
MTRVGWIMISAHASLVHVVQEAKSHGVKLLVPASVGLGFECRKVDAEHTYFQPAIDLLTLELMPKHSHNGSGGKLMLHQEGSCPTCSATSLMWIWE